MSFAITSSQTALALLTGQTKALNKTQGAATQTGPSGAAKSRPPPPPPPPGAATAPPSGAATAQSIFQALSTNFDADRSGSLSASELGSTSPDDATAELFAAMDANGDGEMTSDELGGFLKTLGDAIHGATGDAARSPPPGGPSPAGAKDHDSASATASVTSMLENLIQTRASNSASPQNQTTAALISQFTTLLSQVT